MSHLKYADELIATANAICAEGKGILAADESTGTIGKRFEAISLENNETHRREYRELLFTSPGISNYISGVILYEETLHQKTADGKPFVKVLQDAGIVPGIKVDKGVVIIPGTEGESSTMGLDGLGVRCAEYYKAGARFAKWRAVLNISKAKGWPSELGILENAHGLARYAIICQENGLVPIVEPEVLMDGDHTIEESAYATERVMSVVVRSLFQHKVLFEGMLLKPNMVLAGTDGPNRASPADVAKYTVRTLQRTLPAAVPGVTFLSGGQSEEEASLNLSAMNALPVKKPWALTFSYGRALQASTIKAWGGKPENVKTAQETFIERAKANSEARRGVYKGGAGGAAVESLHVKNYSY